MKTVISTLLICLIFIGNSIAINSVPTESVTAEQTMIDETHALEQVGPDLTEWAQIYERPDPTREEVKATLALYYEALETEDLSLISFTPDVLPGGTTVEGEGDVRLFLANTAELVVEIEILRTVIEGEYACSMANYLWTGDKITPLGICFRVIGDQIAEIHPYFDPRPILED